MKLPKVLLDRRRHVEIIQRINAILTDLYQFIDDTFTGYIISLPAPKLWRDHVERYQQGFAKALREEGMPESEIVRRIEQQSHIFEEGEFKIQVTTAQLNRNLEPGHWGNMQAQRAFKVIYDDWESYYRVEMEKLLGVPVVGDIWGDLRYIRQSLTHRRNIGVEELKKAKVIKDFLPGVPVIFTPTIMEKIRLELENWCTEFQMKHFSPKTLSKKP
jgi:hypothetical protein